LQIHRYRRSELAHLEGAPSSRARYLERQRLFEVDLSGPDAGIGNLEHRGGLGAVGAQRQDGTVGYLDQQRRLDEALPSEDAAQAKDAGGSWHERAGAGQGAVVGGDLEGFYAGP